MQRAIRGGVKNIERGTDDGRNYGLNDKVTMPTYPTLSAGS
jgi:hypothetical protein